MFWERKWDPAWKAEVARQAQRKAATNGGRQTGTGKGPHLAAGTERLSFPGGNTGWFLPLSCAATGPSALGPASLWFFVPCVKTEGGTQYAREL